MDSTTAGEYLAQNVVMKCNNKLKETSPNFKVKILISEITAEAGLLDWTDFFESPALLNFICDFLGYFFSFI